MISFDVFKDSKKKCVTMSFDDGQKQDIKLVELFNKYGIKGTFHLNSGEFGKTSAVNGRTRLSVEEMQGLYDGHEIACHSTAHNTMTQIPLQSLIIDTLEDRKGLEELSGYIVRGMSYPNGEYDGRVIKALEACGIEYSRTVKSNGRTFLPDNFLEWHPTCHYSNALEISKDFAKNPRRGRLLYIWGHSYELDETKYGWDHMENICKTLSEDKDNIWFATNIEIVDFIKAQRALKISVDNKIIYNPSAIDVWVRDGNDIIGIKAGETVRI